MQNNLRNRSVALASAFALALTGIVATAPAAQASNPVKLSPSSGTNTGAFATDEFEMDFEVSSVNDPGDLAIKIVSAGDQFASFKLNQAVASTATLRAFNAIGQQVEIGADAEDTVRSAGTENTSDTDITDVTSRVIVDFDKFNTLVISDLKNSGNTSISGSAARTDLVLELKVYASATDAGVGTNYTYGDGAGKNLAVTSWVEVEGDPNYSTVDSSTASDTATVTWYDPASVSVIPEVRKFVADDGSGGSVQAYLNDATGTSSRDGLAGRLTFTQPNLNLNQVDLNEFQIRVKSATDTTETVYRDLTNVVVNLAGTKGNHDTARALYLYEPNTDGDNDNDSLQLDDGKSYNWEVEHKDDAAVNAFNSVAFTPSTSAAARTIFPTVTDADNAQQDSKVPGAVGSDADGDVDESITLRPGTASFTYNARLYTSVGTARDKVASQTIAAVVTAGTYMPSGTELTVSGSSDTLSAAGQATVVTGLTDSDGDFAVTVTSSNPVALTSYDIEFFSIDENGDFSNAVTDNIVVDDSDNVLTATYTTGAVDTSSLTVVNSTLAGETVTASFVVKDNFGVATNTNGSDQVYVTLRSSDITDLDETVAVAADGTASVTFDNYLATGASDLLTAYVHEGSSYGTLTVNLDQAVISLYNSADAAGVNAPASVTGNVTYDDFITGTASLTNVAPSADEAMQITGTVVDSSGSGVPGALVTVEAAGMQIANNAGGDYFVDSITFAANAAGSFTVNLWSHVLSPTGVDVTITSGGQSATTTVKTYLPTDLSGGNLVFSIDAPANIDVNKTYAIQASLTDKWDNPVATSGDSVDIVGVGSVEINSDSAGATAKNFGRDGKVTVFVRSIKDIEGPGTITATLQTGAVYATSATATDAVDRTEVSVDVSTTAHDETSFSNELTVDVNVGEAAQSSTQKVNAGSFKGYVAVYALGYEGQRLSAKIGNDWVIVDPIVNNESANLARVTDFTGAGYDIAVRIYIDRVLIDTINLTTK